MKIFRPILLGICLLLSACMADIPSRKLDVQSFPLVNMTIVSETGKSLLAYGVGDKKHQLIDQAIFDNTVGIFNKNGVATTQIYVSGIDDIGNLAQFTKKTKTSHILMFKASSIESTNYSPTFLVFDTSLIDVKSEKIVWKSSPKLFIACNKDCDFNIDVKHMLASVLKALNKDGFITLKDNKIVDENNKEF